MKKLLSLVLALVLSVGCMAPVFAESGNSLFSLFNSGSTTQEAFPYTLSEYQMYFNILGKEVLGVDPVWTETATGATASMEGFGDVVVEVNAEGNVTRLSTKMTVGLSDTDAIGNLGMLVALVAMTSKATEDISFVANNADDYTNQLLAVLYGLMDRIGEATTGDTISSTGEVYGDTATFNLTLDVTKMTMTLELVYEP